MVVNLSFISEKYMTTFDSGSFKDLANTAIGEALWEFLNTPNSLIKMETATQLKRPALEAVQLDLIELFDSIIKQDRYKQMIGRMARQIMENLGYSMDQSGVRITSKILFSSATRYKKYRCI